VKLPTLEEYSAIKSAHDKHASREYVRWRNMWKRCTDIKHQAYPYYGGKGITVCERWEDFYVFVFDMGPVPDGMELDRIDNSKNYEPSNCRWVSKSENIRNSSKCRPVIMNGTEYRSIADAAEAIGIRRATLWYRLKSQSKLSPIAYK